MPNILRARLFWIVCGLLLLVAPANCQVFNFVTLDVPCSNCPGGIARRTVAAAINPGGDIVGVYRDATNKSHGFLLSDGDFSNIDVPGELVGATGTLPTIARGISQSGDIVGQFTAPVSSALEGSPDFCPALPLSARAACIKGFVYSRGKYSMRLFPGHPGSVLAAISANGDLYGCFHDLDTMTSMFSASMTRFGIASLTAGGGALSDPSQLFTCSMHNAVAPDGTLVGFYGDAADSCSHTHGYILHNGVLESYDVPNSTSTNVMGITPGHEIVGAYTDGNFNSHGFVQLPGALAVTVDVPSTAPFNAIQTVIQGVNPGGVIVGQYTDAGGHTHGFVGFPVASD